VASQVWRHAGRPAAEVIAGEVIKECARTNQWGRSADRLSVPLTQVKAPKMGRDVLIVLPGSIG